MTDLTPTLSHLLKENHSISFPFPRVSEITDEFLKEAYRINTHIHTLLQYLQSIRAAYLSPKTKPPLTETERDAIDSSTALLLRDLSASLSTLSTAESLRQETTRAANRQPHDISINAIHDSVLWFLRRRIEHAVVAQRRLVERRIDRLRNRRLSRLSGTIPVSTVLPAQAQAQAQAPAQAPGAGAKAGTAVLDAVEAAAIEAKLPPEQLRLFAEENESLMRYYEDTLGKVQNAEKSLLEIASLQHTLVSHLATQEGSIDQLVVDSTMTATNVGRGNRELTRATRRGSTAQVVFWGTVGLCTGLVVWDLLF